MNLWVIFLTGLTTGGLSCLAVQGGLLATAMTRQVTIPDPTVQKRKKSKKHKAEKTLTSVQLPKNPWPVMYFLVAKLFIYTVLGFLLGALGSAIELSSAVTATMQILAGLFMLVTALNMLNVHPIFRYFTIQPPKALTRLVRNQAKSQEVFTPALLGLMTVFIPCGTTQAMEVLAVSSANAILGALIMFAFVLGTSPTFFVLGFLASQVRGKFQQVFAVAAAALIIVLGVVSIDGGLKVLDSPLTPSRVIAALLNGGSDAPSGAPVAAQVVGGVQELTIGVYPTSYTPNYLSAKSGQPIRLHLVTKGGYGCTHSFTIPSLSIREFLPNSGEKVIDIPAQRPGYVRFTCSMGMYSGIISII